MNLYKLDEYRPYLYKRAIRRGTWVSEENHEKRVPPLLIEWLPGSDLLGDFVWPGFGGDVMVKKDVGIELEKYFSGFSLKPVLLEQTSKEVSEYSDVWVKYLVNYDFNRTTIINDGLFIKEEGEHYKKSKNILGQIKEKCIAREKTKGLFISRNYFNDPSFFKLVDHPSWIFCTEEVKVFLDQKKYTNIRCVEVGETF